MPSSALLTIVAAAPDGPWLPLPLQLLVTLGASFLIGLDMEGRKIGGKVYSPGGVRTFPLICLAGFMLTLIGQSSLVPFTVGMAILGLWLAVLYWAKTQHGSYGLTTESYAMLTYILGGLVAQEMYWLFWALTVLMVLAQEMKDSLERLAARMPGDELITIAKFVLLSAVVLPLMPDRAYSQFELNPRRIWLVVVAVTAVSHASYLFHRLTRESRHGLLAIGVLGGVYSSTVTTIALARQSAEPDASAGPMAYAGSILSASGMMNLRLLALIGLFSPMLAWAALWPLLIAGVAGLGVGSAMCLLGRRPDAGITPAAPPAVTPPPEPADKPSAGQSPADAPPAAGGKSHLDPKTSPLELRTAFAFAAIFVVVLVVTHQVRVWLGAGGLLALAGVTGLTDVDPFVMSLTQSPASWLGTTTLAVMIAAAANHLAKGGYAMLFGQRRAGVASLLLLIGLGVVTLASWWLLVAAGTIPGVGSAGTAPW